MDLQEYKSYMTHCLYNISLIETLREKIRDSLTPLITHDYVLLDLPYYDNIGDTLIWEGTREFLKTLPYKCLYYASKDSFRYRDLPPDTVILLSGGGNFGDLYRQHSEFRRIVIESYPRNKVIILPQTIFYEDKELMSEDAWFYAQYKNVTICAREKYSYDLLKAHFSNPCLLVPDMAFFINLEGYKLGKETDKVLYLKRIDKELSKDDGKTEIPKNAEVHDWPTYEYSFLKVKMIEKLFYKFCRLLTILKFSDKSIARLNDWKRNYFYRRFYVQLGIDFLGPYSLIYTTRLHVMILGVLLNKKMHLINNTSGKVVNFYNTWLKEIKNIEV